MIEQIEHIALSVSSLDRSIDFYRNIFDFTVARIIEAGPDVPISRVTGMPGCRARIAHLESGDFMLELFEFQNPRGKPIPDDRKLADIGFTHISFKTTDMKADYRRLKKLGVRFISEPVEFRPGVWVVYFQGPDGEVCEMRQS
jgi:catechol 2,3-dioxygenase-like lactoylglutathione lyase family enzyme